MLVLVFARGVQGFGAGVLQVVVNVAVGRGYSEEMRPKMVAATSSAWVLPSLIGPLIAGVGAQSLSWRWVFLGMLLPVAVASWLAYPAVSGLLVPAGAAEPVEDELPGAMSPKRRRGPTRSPEGDSAGQTSREKRVVAGRAILVAVGAGLFLGGLGDQNNAVRIGLVLAGLALGVPGLVAVLPGRDVPMRSRMLGALAVGALMNLAFFGAEAFMPLTLTSIHHRSATLAGVVLTSASLTWTIRIVGPGALAPPGGGAAGGCMRHEPGGNRDLRALPPRLAVDPVVDLVRGLGDRRRRDGARLLDSER